MSGSKKSSGKYKAMDEKKQAYGGYPTQGSYPTAGNYPSPAPQGGYPGPSAPVLPAGATQYHITPQGGAAPVPQEAPPPYTPYASGPAPPPQPYYQQGYPQPQYVAQGPPPPPQQPQNVAVPGAFDAGARFDGISQPNIPPPPPGYMPNAAQQAAMQGHNVTATQRTAGWFEGPSGGGYTVW